MTEELCLSSQKLSPPQETGPKVLEGSLKKLRFANVFHPFSVQKVGNNSLPLSVLNSHISIPHR